MPVTESVARTTLKQYWLFLSRNPQCSSASPLLNPPSFALYSIQPARVLDQ